MRRGTRPPLGPAGSAARDRTCSRQVNLTGTSSGECRAQEKGHASVPEVRLCGGILRACGVGAEFDRNLGYYHVVKVSWNT